LNKIDSKITDIKKRLIKLYKKTKFIKLLKGLLILIVITLSINLLLSLLELLGLNSVYERTILFGLGLLIFLIALILLVITPLVKIFIPLKLKEVHLLAKIAGKHFLEIDDKLLNVFQLHEDKTNSELKDAAIISELERVEKYNFNSVVSFSLLKNYLIFSIMLLVLAVVLFASFSSLRNATLRIINYSNEYVIPQKYVFFVEPKNVMVTKGENVLIKIEVVGVQPQFITLFFKDKENQSYQSKTLTPDSSKTFQYSINSIVNNTKYYVLAEDVKSDEYFITVLDKPIVTELELKVIPPSYTKLESFVQKDNGNVFAVVGSKVELFINSNKEL